MIVALGARQEEAPKSVLPHDLGIKSTWSHAASTDSVCGWIDTRILDHLKLITEKGSFSVEIPDAALKDVPIECSAFWRTVKIEEAIEAQKLLCAFGSKKLVGSADLLCTLSYARRLFHALRVGAAVSFAVRVLCFQVVQNRLMASLDIQPRPAPPLEWRHDPSDRPRIGRDIDPYGSERGELERLWWTVQRGGASERRDALRQIDDLLGYLHRRDGR